MPPAVAAAGIVAAGTIGGAVLGGSAQKKAASQANAAQQDATQAQLQLGRESMALNKDIYNQNKAILSPFVNRGNVAGDSINALLGLPSVQSAPAPAPTTGTQPGVQQAPVASQTPLNTSNPITGMIGLARQAHGGNLTSMIGGAGPNMRGPDYTLPSIGPQVPGNSVPGASVGTPLPTGGTTTGAPAGGTPAAPTTGGTPAVTPISATSALNNFANSAGMQFQLQQGADTLNNMYAAHGALQSGAAMKALQDYGQQTALNNYFMPYMGLLGGQQSVGAGAASSVAGVGQNFGNTAANINAGMGSNIQNGANSASNAALLRGQANANMYSGIGSALGGLASSFI